MILVTHVGRCDNNGIAKDANLSVYVAVFMRLCPANLSSLATLLCNKTIASYLPSQLFQLSV